MNAAEKNVMKEIHHENLSGSGLLRTLMNKEEIKAANSLCKKGLAYKGVSDDRNRTVVFFLTVSGEELV